MSEIREFGEDEDAVGVRLVSAQQSSGAEEGGEAQEAGEDAHCDDHCPAATTACLNTYDSRHG